MKKLRDDLLTASDYQRIFGVSRRTARRWDTQGVKPEILALARLVKLQDMGGFDQAWAGWILRSGRIYDPAGSSMIGWTPEQVRALEYLHELRRALVNQVEDLKTKAGLPRRIISPFPGDRRRWDRRQTSRPAEEAPALRALRLRPKSQS